MDIYEHCPQFTSQRFALRQVRLEDWSDLLTVYSDTNSVPIFNSDNCTGDFYMTRREDMENCIRFWLSEYAQRYYVRWSVVDLASGCAVGTVELFRRGAQDHFDGVGLLRLDLRSDYETEDVITELVSLLMQHTPSLFDFDRFATKAPACAAERRTALAKLGFSLSPEKLYGHDGRAYGEYWERSV